MRLQLVRLWGTCWKYEYFVKSCKKRDHTVLRNVIYISSTACLHHLAAQCSGTWKISGCITFIAKNICRCRSYWNQMKFRRTRKSNCLEISRVICGGILLTAKKQHVLPCCFLAVCLIFSYTIEARFGKKKVLKRSRFFVTII